MSGIKVSQLYGMPRELMLAAEKALAGENDLRNFCVGCVIVRGDGKMISSRNGAIHSSERQLGKTAHAEARAIRKADYNSTVYVARVRRDGSVGCARPCKSCLNRMLSKRVVNVFYTIGPACFGKLYVTSNRQVTDEQVFRIPTYEEERAREKEETGDIPL